MRKLLICALVLTTSFSLAKPYVPQGQLKDSGDWPCQAVRVPSLSVAAVWAGPPIDAIAQQSWQENPAINDLVIRLAQRRTPLDQATAAITGLAHEPQSQQKLLALFAGLFDTMNHERAQVIEGLDRLGQHQKQMAEQVRAQLTALHQLQGHTNADAGKVQKASDDLTWNMRIFQEKRKAVKYACESPTLIEQRLFALARAISDAMPQQSVTK